jgi:protein TonB
MPQFFEDEEDRTFIQRHGGLVILGVIVLLAAGVFFTIKFLSAKNTGSSRRDDMVSIRLPPPPPPPPKPIPTPPPQKQEPTPPDQKQEDQKMVDQPVVKPEEKEPPKEKPDAPAPLGTSITGPGGGPDLGLGSGLGGGGGNGTGGGGGSQFGWYANGVSQRVQQAILGNPRTRRSTMSLTVRIWPDSTGRVVKVRVSGDTADPAQKAALENEVLNGLDLGQPPPADMPLPIVMKINAERPH